MFGRCKHLHVRCIHGDEVLTTIRAWRKPAVARVRCKDCGKNLYGRKLTRRICDETHPNPLKFMSPNEARRMLRMPEHPTLQLPLLGDNG